VNRSGRYLPVLRRDNISLAGALLDLSNLGSGEKDLASAKAVRPTERARRSQPRSEKGDAADEIKKPGKFGQIICD